MASSINILISGGGTGGHIFPAIAIANEIKRRRPDANILFVGAQDKMEMEKVPKSGYPIEGLWISGFHRGLDWRNLMFPIKLISSYFKSGSIVKKFEPDIAIGTGGFASGPALNAALRHQVPIIIQEQNSYPGVTNKILSKKAKAVCVAYDGMEQFFPAGKIVKTGNPVRQNIVLCNVKPEKARADFDIDIDSKVLFVVGGSLGSRTLNNCMIGGLQELADAGIQVIWQTGTAMYEMCKHAAKGYDNVRVLDFIANIDHAYAAADIIVSRAGAIAISELCLVGKPVILVPFPAAAEDHQTKNAMALVKENAAMHIADKSAPVELIPNAIQLMQDHDRRSLMAQRIKNFAIADAAERIVDEVFKYIQAK
ncbi:MAG TPA: undecaprenyldiphospho-muramoylpentapeptide beta-N-acetylglucosaminyltransferase [Chitinophagales bacterium]|nr:undecaprenyldiphospho-muramoylpentapeptide beta-N-acetylglucosaminyltransferase [Chitinophagales bacterium]HNA59045.1 undecaprenyldiphospho-muramoylpentapeptide beta-N-acetylglucosaminyltransferase [Chitinophagales bacterium]